MAVELISDFALIADRLPTRDSEAVLRTLDAALLAAGPIGAGAASGARATYSFLDTAPLSAHRRACRRVERAARRLLARAPWGARLLAAGARCEVADGFFLTYQAGAAAPPAHVDVARGQLANVLLYLTR